MCSYPTALRLAVLSQKYLPADPGLSASHRAAKTRMKCPLEKRSTSLGMVRTRCTTRSARSATCAGTVVGAAVGAVTATYFRESVWAFGIAVLTIGLLSAVLRVERGTYRYATTTLVIVMLVTRSTSAWRIAIHRSLEVSIGIAVGLVLSALWPEQWSGNVENKGKS